MDINGKAALVTGGGSGIGAEIALGLSRAGARVMITGRRRERLEATAGRSGRNDGSFAWCVTDISVPEECRALVSETVQRFGTVDILVNSAGVLCHGKPIEEHTVEEWDGTFAVNLRAPFLICCEVLPYMRRQKRGMVLMVSSDSGIHHFPDQVIYGLTKHGMNDLVQYIVREYSAYNVHAVAVCPGLTATEMGLRLEPTVRENVLEVETVADAALWAISRPDNLNLARPLVLSPMRDPWE